MSPAEILANPDTSPPTRRGIRRIILIEPCSLSPVNRYPGTGQDSSGRRKQDTGRPLGMTGGRWARPVKGLEGIEVGLQSAGESEQGPIPILPFPLNPVLPKLVRTCVRPSMVPPEARPYPGPTRHVKRLKCQMMGFFQI